MPEMLLFSKELGRRPYRYRLYFIPREQLGSAEPQLYRLAARSRRLFRSLLPGGVYMLTFKGLFLRDAELLEQAELTDEQYFPLVAERDRYFHAERAAGSSLPDKGEIADRYYNSASLRELLDYSPSWPHRIAVALVQAAAYALAILLPVALFLLGALFFIQRAHTDARTFFYLPVAITGLVPLSIWLMATLHTLLHTLLLNIDFFRYDLLRRYALREGGLKRSCSIAPATRWRILLRGLICLIVFCVCTLLVTLLL